MATLAEVLDALPAFRNDLMQRQQLEPQTAAAPFRARGAFAAFASPLSNLHATGAGIRQRGGRYLPDEIVLKMYVFDKVGLDAFGEPPQTAYEGVPIDVEHLPIQRIRPARVSAAATTGRSRQPSAAAAAAGVPSQRQRLRPTVGGLSISPINAQFVGTLGCFLRRQRVDGEDIFALSNNHVLADTDRLPRGTEIVQPGPEVQPLTPPADVFATLSGTIPLRFPASGEEPVANRFDAAIARVADLALISPQAMFSGLRYDPARVVPPRPGMRVVKAGRTTGVTRGIVTATNVDGVLVNYGTQQSPRIATFENCIEIVSTTANLSFSLPGDSGSVILEESTGHPVALLFAGDGVTTTACDLGGLCRRLRAFPV